MSHHYRPIGTRPTAPGADTIRISQRVFEGVLYDMLQADYAPTTSRPAVVPSGRESAYAIRGLSNDVADEYCNISMVRRADRVSVDRLRACHYWSRSRGPPIEAHNHPGSRRDLSLEDVLGLRSNSRRVGRPVLGILYGSTDEFLWAAHEISRTIADSESRLRSVRVDEILDQLRGRLIAGHPRDVSDVVCTAGRASDLGHERDVLPTICRIYTARSDTLAMGYRHVDKYCFLPELPMEELPLRIERTHQDGQLS